MFFAIFSVKPAKQLITDERMAAHLNSLHISSNYTPHTAGQTGTATTTTAEASQWDGHEYNASASSYAAIASHDLEQKLRNASRITVCEEIRKLAADPILPQAILERFERPCTALVLWQPPQRIADLIVSKEVEAKRKNDDANADNNNSMTIDLNNETIDAMDLEVEM